MRRFAVVATTVLVSLGMLQTPANAWFDDCVSYATLHSNGQGTEVEICVSVNGSLRAAYLVGYQTNYSSVFVDISSIYLRQCNSSGGSCVLIAQNAGVSGGGSSATFLGDEKPVSFGHTYIACASLSVNSDRYTNVCSTYRTN